jgi:hypothetical protein
MFKRFRLPRWRPSMPTAISLLALSIVLTGTAWAATGQLVNIIDPHTAGHVARVDKNGGVRTSATPPAKPLQGGTYLFKGTIDIIGPSSGQVALSRVGMSNSAKQFEGKTAVLSLTQRAVSSQGTCTGNSVVLGQYQVKPGDTVIDPMPSPLVLRPLPGAAQWCLVADVDIDLTSYYLPLFFFNGWVMSGTVAKPLGTASAPAAASASGKVSGDPPVYRP